ncbi:MAG: bile acid:sodium symporter family protein [Lachnospiraceae bacterium]|nr:bile acid:sodium symporter family protein [Lachnospiraceae bacterium]
MKKIGKVASFLSQNIGVIIIICSLFAFWKPQTISWATQYTSIFLGTAMFGMGLTIRPADFKSILVRPKAILLGVLCQYTIMPITAFALCKALHLPADIALGVILVGCCPGGTASNVITYIAGGDVALSVGMTIVSTLLAPFLTPLMTFILAGSWVKVSLFAMIISVIKVVLIPVVAGIILNALVYKYVEKVKPVLPLISVIAIVAIISGIVANNKENLLASGLMTLAVVMLHNVIGMFIGFGVAKLFHCNYAQTTAISIEVGMQNSGLAVSLATANFAANPMATLPGAIFSVWHNIAGSIFASLRKHGEQEEVTNEAKEAV